MEDEKERAEDAPEQGDEPGQGPDDAEARIAELEQTITARDSEIAGLKQAGHETEEKLAAAAGALAEAVAGYKAMVVSSNPEVMEELIGGESIRDINESLEKAKALVSRVRQDVEAGIAQGRVPAGAPERTPPDLSNLSAREKIQYAIGGK